MRLKRLEINGFKSFGKKTTFAFDVPITSIVGPNGSGKSNVAESLRWVLGEQSMKSLRGKRGEDLIFNGSSSAPRQNRASVSLTFDNKDRRLPLEFEEVTVAREVGRDGSNEYSINGSQVRLRDIVELLSAVSLGPSGHHIISQGEADRVLSANAKERREILEDALGLKIYQFKIAESAKRLDKTEENMKDVGALRREIAPHLKFLKKQVEEVEKVVTMRQELGILASDYFAAEAAYLVSIEKTLKTEHEEVRTKLAELDKELADKEAKISFSDKGDSALWSEIRNLENSLSETRTRKDDIGRALGRLEGQLIAEPVQKSFVIKNAETGEESCKYCGQVIRIEVNTGVQREMEEKRAHLEAEREKLENERIELQSKERGLGESIDAARRKMAEGSAEARAAERALFDLKTSRNELRASLEKIALRQAQYENEHAVFTRDAREIGLLTGHNVLSNSGGLSSGGGEVPRDMQDERRRKIERLKIKVEDAGGVGTDVVREYQETAARDEHLAKELADLETSATSLKKLMEDLRVTLEEKFKNGLTLVNAEFQSFFERLFNGGHASLMVVKVGKPEKVMIDGEEVETESDEQENPNQAWGIEINVNLPKKKIKGLEMLSGGERALTSIALIFALSQVNPPPFLVLDETDAALDEANSRRYGEMLSALSAKSQLLVITHNRETMSHAQVLYGVTMGSDSISKLLSIRFEEAAAFAK